MGNAHDRNRNYTPEEVQKIVRLLVETDLTFKQIAERFGNSNKEHLVAQINREHNVRPAPPKKGEGIPKKQVRKRVYNPLTIKGSFL